jgi:protein phosphatase 1 regulatory subunit 37
MQSADKPGQRQLLLTSGPISKTGPRAAFVNVDPPLGKYAAQAFSDVLSVEWGLAKLALQDGVLDQDEVSRAELPLSVVTAEIRVLSQSVKPILHALLVSGTLPQLSLSGNRKLRSPGWRMVAAYIRKVSHPLVA